MVNVPKYILIYNLFQQYFQMLAYLLFIDLVQEHIIQMQLRMIISTFLLNYCSNVYN